jgi:outer membrane scaffolding protein for murein synthesis (MipA/OmpV family)
MNKCKKDKKICEWVATWGESPVETSVTTNTKSESFDDKNLRMIIHISLGGKSFRVRLSNAYPRAINLECDIQNNFVTIQKVNIAI